MWLRRHRPTVLPLGPNPPSRRPRRHGGARSRTLAKQLSAIIRYACVLAHCQLWWRYSPWVLVVCVSPPQGHDDGGLHIRLVLERRPSTPPNLPKLNKWQLRKCAQCQRTQSTGTSQRCQRRGLIYLPCCVFPHMRTSSLYRPLRPQGGVVPLPGAVVLQILPRNKQTPAALAHDPPARLQAPEGRWHAVRRVPLTLGAGGVDCRATRHQVSNAAAEFLDAVWEHPLLDLTVVAPNLLHSHKKLAMMAQARIDMNTAVVRVGRAAVLTRVLAHPTDRVLSGNWRSRKMQSMCCRVWCHRTCATWWSTRRSCRLPT